MNTTDQAPVARGHVSVLEPWLGLDPITRDGINLVHVARPLALDAELQPWLATTRETGWEWNGAPESLVGSTLETFLEPLPPQTRSIARQDVPELARRIALYTHRKHVRVRFDVVRTDSCRKFHQDYVALRLLVTYAGAGTEWVENPNVVRSELGRVDVPLLEANTRIVPDPSTIKRAAVGDVLILKGASFSRNEHNGAVHRSPPIEQEAGHARLVLRIDVASCSC